MLHGDVLVLEPVRLLVGRIEQAGQPLRDLDLARRDTRAADLGAPRELGLVGRLLMRMGADAAPLRADLERRLERRPRTSGPGAAQGQVYVSRALNRVLDTAEQEAERLRDDYVSVEHVLLAMLATGSETGAGRLLREHGADRDAAGGLWLAPSQVAVMGRVQRLRAGLGLNYAAVGLVTDLLDRIAVLEAALQEARRPGR